MAKPLVVSFSHQIGKAESVRRLTEGLDYIKAHYGHLITVNEARWVGDRLEFNVSALAQSASGFVDVEEERVTITVMLPFLLAMVADKARALIQKEGTLLLERKPPPGA
ncbi:MAG: polyhydroxyalkanoic acid system family protein [Parafilimonas terrae]|nr:polyhydroxyalkanoic acid system family protein [Parafilimonas terrae]